MFTKDAEPVSEQQWPKAHTHWEPGIHAKAEDVVHTLLLCLAVAAFTTEDIQTPIWTGGRNYVRFLPIQSIRPTNAILLYFSFQ